MTKRVQPLDRKKQKAWTRAITKAEQAAAKKQEERKAQKKSRREK